MSKRQIIILSIMAIAILYGIYELFIAGPVKIKNVDPGKRSEELDTFLGNISAGAKKDSPSPADLYIIARAEAAWLHNPFYERESYKVWLASRGSASGEAKQVIKFNYHGYLVVGKGKMAIINNVEYKTGEQLEIEGYFLKNISPQRIVIEKRADRTRFDVPLQEQ